MKADTYWFQCSLVSQTYTMHYKSLFVTQHLREIYPSFYIGNCWLSLKVDTFPLLPFCWRLMLFAGPLYSAHRCTAMTGSSWSKENRLSPLLDLKQQLAMGGGQVIPIYVYIRGGGDVLGRHQHINQSSSKRITNPYNGVLPRRALMQKPRIKAAFWCRNLV